ncbi:hypothetical protein AVEN_83523-1 [Araneus ventricosus]|uniref:RNA-directed DNA polymerase n=1 Tax=Araneus ventricosus TaxID=182803 RepID=A0A4Y2IFU0_ARAVE|nr:hypothetical protein AVEN_83523-1 [Araneus ventricosus]
MWDVSTGNIRHYVPGKVRKTVFDSIQPLPHPGCKTTVRLNKDRFIWPTLQKDCTQFSKHCITYQYNKISRHIKSLVGQFPLTSARFKHIHLDIVGPLPPSEGNHYCLSCVNRFYRWQEVYPIPGMKAETYVQTFLQGWIARFGVPEIVTTNRGSQFESELLQSFTRFLGSGSIRITSYHYDSNGMV